MNEPRRSPLEDLADYLKTPELDGCFFCGGSHRTEACDRPERTEFYNEIDER